MKQKHVFLSMALLCLGLITLAGCGTATLPEPTTLFFDQTSSQVNFVNKGSSNGSYLSRFNSQEIKDMLNESLTSKMKENLVEVQTGSFVNTPFRLTIDQLRLRQSRGCVIKCDSCGISTFDVQKVRIDLRLSLYKNGAKLKSWKFCEKSRESVSKINNSNSWYSSSDECPQYKVSPNSISIDYLLASCAQRARNKIARRMKRNL